MLLTKVKNFSGPLKSFCDALKMEKKYYLIIFLQVLHSKRPKHNRPKKEVFEIQSTEKIEEMFYALFSVSHHFQKIMPGNSYSEILE